MTIFLGLEEIKATLSDKSTWLAKTRNHFISLVHELKLVAIDGWLLHIPSDPPQINCPELQLGDWCKKKNKGFSPMIVPLSFENHTMKDKSVIWAKAPELSLSLIHELKLMAIDVKGYYIFQVDLPTQLPRAQLGVDAKGKQKL
jgi:hypothetical protein